MGLSHRVSVFVFHFFEEHILYLLLRRQPARENSLGPVRGVVKIDEHLQDAVLREVREETGLVHPMHLIDLHHTSRFLLGDEGLIDWEFGFQTSFERAEAGVRPGRRIVETRWAEFDEAFENLDLPEDRETLVRLQMMLRAG